MSSYWDAKACIKTGVVVFCFDVVIHINGMLVQEMVLNTIYKDQNSVCRKSY